MEWVVIKGVSDFADGKKSDTDAWRPFASVMAASLTAHILSDPIAFEHVAHYEGNCYNSPTPEATRGVGTSLYDSYISSVTSVNLKKADMASRNNVMFKKQYTLF